jgi:hypothetical protein
VQKKPEAIVVRFLVLKTTRACEGIAPALLCTTKVEIRASAIDVSTKTIIGIVTMQIIIWTLHGCTCALLGTAGVII